MNTDSVYGVTYNTIVSITYKSVYASYNPLSLTHFFLSPFLSLSLALSLALFHVFIRSTSPFRSPHTLKHILHIIFYCMTGWWPAVTRTVASAATTTLNHLVPPPP